MRTRAILFISVTILFGVVGFISSSLAQDASCEAFLQPAFVQLNQSCATLPGSSACFGSSAGATFVVDSQDGFSQPGDQVPLSNVQAIQTHTENETWGLALLNVHANIPLNLSEQGLKYILIGDVNVQNAVDADRAFTPVASIIVTPLVASNLRSSASKDARILGNATVGTELTADGQSRDGKWLRVMSEDQVAWISRQIVAEKEGNISTLPVITSDTRTLMQSFLLNTGSSTPICTNAPPSILAIQSPSGVSSSITVNGIDIRFEGTIILQTTPDNVLQFVVLDGGGSTGGVTVPTGFTLNIPFNPDGGDAGSATGLRPINDNERQFLAPIASGLNPSLLYKAFTVPSPAEVNAILAQINGAAGSQVVSGPAAGQAECSRFKPTSPLSSMPLGVTPFFWDAAPGATTYRINLFANGAIINSIEASASSTTSQIDTNSFGEGSNFSWSIDALVNGQLACSSGRVSVVRDAFAQFVSSGNNGSSDGGGSPAPTATPCSWQGC